MCSLKTTAFAAIFTVVCGVAGVSRAALPLTDMPQPQQGSIYLQLVDSEALMTGRGILNGYKGYRHHRPGYRRHSDNWWYPREAFETKPVPSAGEEKMVRHRKALPEKHVGWCMERYRSYRQEDNTFQPYDGPRRICSSPYLQKD